MTTILRDTLHEQADRLDTLPLDLDRVVRDGDRQLTRRRLTVATGGLAAAVVVGLAVPPLMAEDTGQESRFAAAFSAHDPAYAKGSTVHVDGRTFDVGHPVHAMVQTDTGVVFTDPQGTVYAADGASVSEVGRTGAEHPSLEADGSIAAWTERDGDQPVYAALDQATGEVTRDELESTPGMGTLRDTDDPALVYAVDGQTVYVRDSRGLVAWTPATGEQAELGQAGGFTVMDVKDGRIAYQGGGEGPSTYVGPTLGDGTELDGSWNVFALSPDARHAIGETEPDVAAVFDTGTGEALPVSGDHDFVVGYGWADGDTWVGLGIDEPYDGASIDLISCEVAGPCTTIAAGIGSPEDGVVVPSGEAMDG